LGVGGLDNPVLKIAESLVGTFHQTRVMSGRLAAQSVVTDKASDLCAAARNPTNEVYGGTPYTPGG